MGGHTGEGGRGSPQEVMAAWVRVVAVGPTQTGYLEGGMDRVW